MQNNFYDEHSIVIDRFIAQALHEDIEHGDHSSNACFEETTTKKVVLKVKEACIIAGIDLAVKIFQQYDPSTTVITHAKDGYCVEAGSEALTVEGLAKSILATERLVLNCMQRMSGIATLSRRLSDKISHTSCKILDTRKTTPGFRYPEKWAVSIGGGYNHRMGLFDAIMIKDNHIDFCGGVAPSLEKTKSYLSQNKLDLPVIVEARNTNEIEQIMRFPWVDRILLDNMRPEVLQENLEIIQGQFPTEASGNITEENLISYAETGVDFISMGVLTYGAKPVDLSLKAV
ncbi:MAG: carboxylating nicotinate-nucleotide diphosphorylase [Flavobacteriia bacterium]|nr:carboxylating nicotinate-nucleotide diphosphorylase [Flavobacteriia bacterium]